MTGSQYKVFITSFFEKDVQRLTRKNKKLFLKIVNLKQILEDDPCNLSRQFEIKKLKGIKPGEGQYRIRWKEYRLRYDIFNKDVILYSFRHRKEAY